MKKKFVIWFPHNIFDVHRIVASDSFNDSPEITAVWFEDRQAAKYWAESIIDTIVEEELEEIS